MSGVSARYQELEIKEAEHRWTGDGGTDDRKQNIKPKKPAAIDHDVDVILAMIPVHGRYALDRQS